VLLKRNRTSSKYIYYALHLYFSGLSLRRASEHLFPFIKRNHVSVWNWIQRFKPKKILQNKRKVSEFIIDETLLKVGNQYVWLWIAIEPTDKLILGIKISFERSILVAERFLQELVRRYGKHPVSTDSGTWYPQACKFAKIKHHLNSFHERSIIERTVQYFKDRTECFDDYFPCRRDNCKLEHVSNWMNQFVYMHNRMLIKEKIK
jgi:putative transposase